MHNLPINRWIILELNPQNSLSSKWRTHRSNTTA